MSLENRVVDEQLSSVLYWFSHWDSRQKEDFLGDLIQKAVPHKLFAIITAMDSLSVDRTESSVFSCQLRLFTQWFNAWTDGQRNMFLRHLEEIDPDFVGRFNDQVMMTCGQP